MPNAPQPAQEQDYGDGDGRMGAVMTLQDWPSRKLFAENANRTALLTYTAGKDIS